MKRNFWKILVLLALAIAVIAVMNGKRPSGGGIAAQPQAMEDTNASPSAESPASAEASGDMKEEGVPRLVDLGSKTCIPCKMMAPILDELREENTGTVAVIFYDVSEQQEKAREYGIRVIPTQVFFGKNGKEFFRHEGFMPKADIIAKFKEKGIALKEEK